MAAFHHSRKVKTYRSLNRINHHFHSIVKECWTLEKAGYMPILKMGVQRNFVRELQAQISRDVLGAMLRLENQDCFDYGKKRIAREHYLNPDRPAFRAGSVGRLPSTVNRRLLWRVSAGTVCGRSRFSKQLQYRHAKEKDSQAESQEAHQETACTGRRESGRFSCC
jgi:hypothetical protein